MYRQKRNSINEWIFCRTEIFRKSKSWIKFVLLYNKSRLKTVTGNDASSNLNNSKRKVDILDNFAARLKQANLVNKTDFDDKLKNLNKKITSSKTKHVLVKKWI